MKSRNPLLRLATKVNPFPMFPVLRRTFPLRNTQYTLRFLCILWLLGSLSACLPPALPRVVKIGLVAPFEGVYRAIGYDAVYAARLAIREINAAGGVGDAQLELVAYDDRGDVALAVTAAHNLAADPTVVAVIGHYHPASTAAAWPIYTEAGLPLLVIGAWVTPTEGIWQLTPPPELLPGSPVVWEAVAGETFITPYPMPQDLPSAGEWIASYRAVGPHVPAPGMYALPTYEAVYMLAQALAAPASSSREEIGAALPLAARAGLLGAVHWDALGYWDAAPLYRYHWEGDVPVLIAQP